MLCHRSWDTALPNADPNTFDMRTNLKTTERPGTTTPQSLPLPLRAAEVIA